MPATNDFQPVAVASGANVVTQAEYLALTSLLADGLFSGIVPSNQLNKILRQATIMSAVIGQLIAEGTGQNATDDGTTATLVANLARVVRGDISYAADTGVANAYAITLAPAPAALSVGMIVGIDNIVASNTGASTLNVNGFGAVAIVGPTGAALQGGELIATYGALFRLNHAGTAWQLIWTSGGATPIAPATQSKHAMQLGQAVGRLLNVQVFTTSGTYTQTAGTNKVRIRAIGAGGAGGGTVGTSAGQASIGGAGASGADTEYFGAPPASGTTVTIGAAGAGAVGARGGDGGTTIVGTLLSVGGGGGGSVGSIISSFPAFGPGGGSVGAVNTAGNVYATGGNEGGFSLAISATGVTGPTGANSPFGSGGPHTANGTGYPASGYGAGGSAASAIQSQGALAGGNGTPGLVIIEEYA